MDNIEVYLGPINGTIKIQLIRKKIKNIHLKVFRSLNVTLSVPEQVSDEWINSFLLSRSGWIDNQITKYKKNSGYNNLTEIRNGSSTQLLGKDMRIYTEASLTNRICIDEKKIYLYLVDVTNDELAQKELGKWWRQTAKEVYQKEIDYFYESVIRKYEIPKPKLIIRKMKTLWGSCTPQKK